MSEHEGILNRAQALLGQVFKRSPATPAIPTAPVVTEEKLPEPLLRVTGRDALFQPSYKTKDIIDIEKGKEEKRQLDEELNAAQAQTLKEGTPNLPPKDGQIYKAVTNKSSVMVSFLGNLAKDYNSLSKNGPFFRSYYIRHQIISAAAELITYNCFTTAKSYADKYNLGAGKSKYFSLARDLFSGYFDIKVGDLTLADILNKDAETKYSPGQIYQFMAGFCEITASKTHKQVLTANRENLLTRYPNYFINLIDTGASVFYALASSTPKTFEAEVGSYGGNTEVTAKAKKLVEHFDKIRQNIFLALLHPDSPQFPKLRQAVELTLSGNKKARISILNRLGLQESHNVPRLYRAARALAQLGLYPEFYNRLAGAVKEYAAEIPASMGILTEDDLAEIIDTEKVSAPSETPSNEELSKALDNILSKTSQSNFIIDPALVDCSPLIPPQGISLTLSPALHRFNLQLNYSSETGESISVEFGGNLRKDHLDWSFIEGPEENSTFSALRSAFMCTTQAALSEALKQAQQIFDQRQREKNPVPQPAEPAQKREKNGHPGTTYLKRSEVVKEIKESNGNSSTEHPAEEKPEPLVDDSVKRVIMIPTETDWVKLIPRDLSPLDLSRIKKGVAQFNETQLGEFRPLQKPGPDGKPLLSLHIGNMRVLATPIESNGKSGNQEFRIINAAKRKDVYRKL